ncbi:hypothetical protein GVN16_07595 [Emticicia sp. CRIBPO]|uniref:hypothetical protein n=1 Tax=Emticicia sp. CRIBPO TaxID=2683258 RepID=UPI001411EBBD|nr:hypothetical protein [Emticicia sp. CRIBPO]NBA85618.1 hypothetical protein [Emticicia sp. CRIBPO]
MSFEEYLVQKKINGEVFREKKPALYAEWKTLFEQVHPESFTLQKKFLINNIRREFLLPAQ